MRDIARPFRVMHVLPMLTMGGTEARVLELLRAARGGGFEHCLCGLGVTDEMRPHMDALRGEGFKCFDVERAGRFDLGVIAKMRGLFRRERVAVFHGRDFTSNSWGRVAATLAGVPVVIAGEHGGIAWKMPAPMAAADRLLLLRTDCVVANSVTSKILLRELLGAPESKIEVVMNGIMGERFRPIDDAEAVARTRAAMGVAPGEKMALFVGRLVPQKGVEYLVDAVAHLGKRADGIKVVIVGDGRLGDAIRSRAEEKGVAARFHFAGRQWDAVPEIVGACDFMVLPSIWESFGNVVVEGWLCGKPTVAAAAGSLTEIIIDGVDGVLIPVDAPLIYGREDRGWWDLPDYNVDARIGKIVPLGGPNIEAFGEAIRSMADDPGKCRKMGDAGRKKALANFTFRQYTENLEAVYRRYLARKGL